MDFLDFYQSQLVTTKNYIAEISLYQSLVSEAKQHIEAANAHVKELAALFQQQGDHQKEVDEIFARIAKNTLSAVNASTKTLMTESMIATVDTSDNKATTRPVKGQEFHIYTGEPPSALGEVPSGELLCKAIFGGSAIIATSGKASYGLLVKDNQYVHMVDISTVPAKDVMLVDTLNFYQGAFFTIDNW